MREYEFRYSVNEHRRTRIVVNRVQAKWPRQAIKIAEQILARVEYVGADLVFFRKRQHPDIQGHFFVHADELRYKVVKTWGNLNGAKSLPIGTIG